MSGVTIHLDLFGTIPVYILCPKGINSILKSVPIWAMYYMTTLTMTQQTVCQERDWASAERFGC